MQYKHFLALPVVAALAFSSCGDGNKPEDSDVNLSDSTKETAVSKVPETFYQLPSPGETLNFIKLAGGKNNKNTSFLNSAENLTNYTDNKLKALNFGVYSCDLSYCSIFEIGADALRYFKVVKQLGDQIGVSTAIKPEVLKRFEANLGNADSIAAITDDVYFTSTNMLENGQQGPTMSLVMAGGWIESLYIASNLAKYEAGSPLVDRLADQKYALDNLIEFMKKYESDANVAAILPDLQALLVEFNKIGEKEAPAALKTTDSKGKHVLGGGRQLVISAEQYKAITEKIKAIRNSYTLNK